jgi:hypothetical protein
MRGFHGSGNDSGFGHLFATLVAAENDSNAGKHLLRLSFDDREKARMHELSERNQEGTITPEELHELDQFVRVGMVLSIMQSRARQQLKSANKKTEH